MPRVLILGAKGSIAREARDPTRPGSTDPDRIRVVHVKLAMSPELEVRHSLGVSKPL